MISLVFVLDFLIFNNRVCRFDKYKDDSSVSKKDYSAAEIEDVDSNHQFSNQEYDSCINGAHSNDTSNNLSDLNDFEQHSIDHQLKLTLDNLRQIHIAVEGK